MQGETVKERVRVMLEIVDKIQFNILNVTIFEHAQFSGVRCCKVNVQLKSVGMCVYS
jgi:hypothetical protein